MTDGRDPGRVVLVFGASSGIGLAVAERLARRGDRLVLVARSDESVQAAARRCRASGARDVEAVTADIAIGREVDGVVDGAVERFGRLDAVVLAAGVMAYGRVEDVPAEVFDRVVATLVTGTANVARAVLPRFAQQGGGKLIVINSLLGSVTVPRMGAYAAAKWGQRALTRTLQQEARSTPGVHVGLISPGAINTPIYYQAANYLGREVRPPWPVRSPEKVAQVVERMIDRPTQHVSAPIGVANPLIITGFRLLPFVYDRIVAPLFRLASVTGRAAGASPGNVERPRPDLERVHGRWPDRDD